MASAQQMDHTRGMKAVEALARLPSSDIVRLLPFLNHSMFCFISEVLTNILYYDAGKRISSRKRNQIKRVMTPEKLQKFRQLALIRISQKTRRELILELKEEVGIVLSKSGHLLNVSNQDASKSANDQGDQVFVQDVVLDPQRVDESALLVDEAESETRAHEEIRGGHKFW